MMQQLSLPDNCRTAIAWLLLMLMLVTSSGCWVVDAFRGIVQGDPEDVLPPEISTTELVAHVNKNIHPLISWQSTDVHITTKTKWGVPMRISADIAVESPRNFRLIARSIAGNEADFGSNDERFWFWIKRSKEKRVVTIAHEDFPQAQQRLQMPFHPEWMMEALGVIPIDETNVTVEKDPSNAGILQLTSKQTLYDGKQVYRIIQVDTRRGHILAHSLYSADGTLVAQATLNNYKIEKDSGIAMPHEILLNWPPQKMQMKMTIGDVEINPEHLPTALWSPPESQNIPRFDYTPVSNRYPLQRQ